MLVMPNFASDLYLKSENVKGRKLVLVLVLIVISSLLLGILITNITSKLLKKDEPPLNNGSGIQIKESNQFEGKVVYVDPIIYPGEDVSYLLEDNEGNEIVLLKADDEKLTVVEGFNVVLFGKLTKSKDKKNDILMVEKIVIKSKK